MQLIRAMILVGMGALVPLPRHAGAHTVKELNTIADIYAAIRICWTAPNVSGPAELVVRLSFTRDGKILGKAHVTYENRTVSDEDRLLYRTAVIEAFERCTPFPFSSTLGDAIAGRPINFRFRSNSGLRI
jgi:hypothetical protein